VKVAFFFYVVVGLIGKMKTANQTKPCSWAI